MHCVRGYGHLLQLFSALTKQPNACPPKVMLHSYSGSVEEIPKFCKLRGIGDRFYFSFSHAINAQTPEKLAARIAAVPDDRLLIESDQVGIWARCECCGSCRGWCLYGCCCCQECCAACCLPFALTSSS
jgi:TatD DNase family protein